NIEAEDLMATLSRFTVDTICQAIRQVVIGQSVSVFASGGGIHNDHLRKQLQEALPGYRIETTADLHINPDAKEAILFALLANECVAGDPATWREGNKGMPAVSMGKISFPS
ncbi:MAG TPA: anhydro-N-acetylmuramic acid kinase, partial [Ferruginibacter sp.]|nr:anhydro-N-acetylmuramic acid kinase [Ferruginibacter sp.]